MDKYHYTRSGLQNVWLLSGFELRDTPYGKGIAINDIDGLHKTIAHALVEKKRALTGAEFRFLRIELDLSQRQLGKLVGKDSQTIHRWERAAEIPELIDFLMRHIYKQTIEHQHQTYMELVNELSAADREEGYTDFFSFTETDEGWKKAS